MTELNFPKMREAMVKCQLRTSEVNAPAVLRAILAVPREEFVAPAYRGVAYNDRALPVSSSRLINPPLATGRMVEALAPRSTDNVLIIGGGTGYDAAVLAQLSGTVTFLEEDADLAMRARDLLSLYPNVHVVEGPLKEGHQSGAPYNLILIAGAVEQVPHALAAQLHDDGAIVLGLLENPVTRLMKGRKAGTSISLVALADMDLVPLPAFATSREFSF